VVGSIIESLGYENKATRSIRGRESLGRRKLAEEAVRRSEAVLGIVIFIVKRRKFLVKERKGKRLK